MSSTDELHVIVGAGPVGSALAARLAATGHRIRLATRSGRSTATPGVDAVAVDASDSAALSAQAAGAAVLYNCANPGPYPVWEEKWPPLAASLLRTAEETGAVLVTASNLYGYGVVHEPMTRHTPLDPVDHKGALRARMWEDALAAHRAGRVRTAEARSSDYIGPSVPAESGLIARYGRATLAGKTAVVFADPDHPHTWTAIDDVAATLEALGRDEGAWGSAWIVPSNAPRTVREVLNDLAEAAGAAPPRVRRVPRPVLRAGGMVVPLLREVNGVLYQFDGPFVADGSETTSTFGVSPTPWRTVIEQTAQAWSGPGR
ncbi:NAD-dependent epimerase/dehydratase family protein [Dietzia sp. SYD-A1]|uniref:NAD-dependent epimerase/dehydratase family protein n=1 Tax=Dietzia sp. SYD-A1 TaxID=2780141 RepID=UPI0018918B0B|nr:NAD-dependent epimerase/dehydratase family protein [Dietzia sp. SYD-A1]